MVVRTPWAADFTDCEVTVAVQNWQDKSQQCFEMNSIQCRLARVALGWGVRDLALAANVSTQTISRLEAGEQLRVGTLDSIRKVLEDSGIEFIPENRDGGVGIRLKNRRRDV